MGMFDWIKIDKDLELPMPAQISQFNLHELEFQTKSLDSCLRTYLLRKDGLFVYEKEDLKNTNFHGVIDFGSYHSTDLADYVFDFKAKYTDGNLVDVQFCKFQEFFHESKNDKIKRIHEKIKKQNRKLYVRLIMSVQNSLVFLLRYLGIKVESKFLGYIVAGSFSITFYFPRLTIPFLRNRNIINYGFIIEDIDTGLNFSSCPYENCFVLKILGLGFSVQRSKTKFLEELSKGTF